MGAVLGQGVGIRLGWQGRSVAYAAETLALSARFSVQATPTRLRWIDAMIVRLKLVGVWPKLDALYLLAAHDAQAARQNWVANACNLTAVSSPTFSSDLGYIGDGFSAYLETGFNPATASSPKYAQSSAHLGLWSLTALAASGIDMGNGNSLVLARQTSSDLSVGRVNLASSHGSTLPSAGVGHFVANRTGATDMRSFADGAVASPNNGLSSIPPDNSAIRIGGRSGAVSYSLRRIAAAHYGSGLSDQNIADLYTAIRTYLRDVGAVA